jgi:hypothetical protein
VLRASILLLAAAIAAVAETRPVLVELFTSEGCSSCPPADLLLNRLRQNQESNLIVLSEHVDYWNQLGWIDPFSSNAFTNRQRRYAGAIGVDVYTPQMVVDGTAAFVGSDNREALAAISHAARAPKANIVLRCAANPPAVQIRIDHMPPAEADVILAITEDGLQSTVTAGENRGRTMAHTAVARRLSVIGRTKKEPSFAAQNTIALDKIWKRENVAAVVFLQDRSNLRILGASRIALTACAAN